MYDAMDECMIEELVVRDNDSMTGMRKVDYDVLHDYCLIWDALHWVPLAVKRRADFKKDWIKFKIAFILYLSLLGWSGAI